MTRPNPNSREAQAFLDFISDEMGYYHGAKAQEYKLLLRTAYNDILSLNKYIDDLETKPKNFLSRLFKRK